jgi:Flp pilus assembly protein TadG
MRRFNQRGQIIIFTMIALTFLVLVGGTLTSDIGKMVSAKQKAQTAVDAAALAAAGKLGFDATAFGAARSKCGRLCVAEQDADGRRRA